MLCLNVQTYFCQIKCTQYWPDVNRLSDYGPVSVKLIGEKEYAFYIERILSVRYKEVSEIRSCISFNTHLVIYIC